MAQPLWSTRVLALAALLLGLGCGWGRCRIEGLVLASDGSPLPAAEVAVLPAGLSSLPASLDRLTWTATDSRGWFKASLPPGSYALAITHPLHGGLNTGTIHLGRGDRYVLPDPVSLAAGPCQVTGQVESPEGDRDAVLAFTPIDPAMRAKADGLLVVRARAGQFQVGLVPGLYRFSALAPRLCADEGWLEAAGSSMTLQARLRPLFSPAPGAVKAFLRHHARALASTDPEGPMDDLSAPEQMFGQARVIGLGEATHGAREFYQLKHRLLRAMARTPQATVLAMTMNLAAAFAVEDFLLEGKGDPWPFIPAALRNEDLRELILWARAYNEHPGPAGPIHWYGFDMAEGRPAFEWALSYLRTVDRREAARMGANLETLAAAPWEGPPAAPEQVRAWRAELVRLQARTQAMQRRWTARTSPKAYARCLRCLVLLDQFAQGQVDRYRGTRFREQAMANNALWIMAQEPQARILLWAHNGHVSRSLRGRADYPPMGWYLHQAMGEGYLPIGLTFHQGGVAALREGKPVECLAEPQPRGTLDQAMADTGLALLLLDLRRLPTTGEAANWFQSPQGTWSIGWRFDPARADEAILVDAVTDQFDALLFVARTTPARVNPTSPTWH